MLVTSEGFVHLFFYVSSMSSFEFCLDGHMFLCDFLSPWFEFFVLVGYCESRYCVFGLT